MDRLTDIEMSRLKTELLTQMLFEVLGVDKAAAQAAFLKKAEARVDELFATFSEQQLSQMLFSVSQYD